MSLIQAVFVSLCFQFLTCGSQTIYKTFLDDAILPCEVDTDTTSSYAWTDGLVNTEVIYVVSSNNPVKLISEDDKYDNFLVDVSSYPTSVPLTIQNILLEDEGFYRCSVLIENYAVIYDLHVEALPLYPVTISCTRPASNACPSSLVESDEFTCTCIAIAAYPDNLRFEWTNADGTTERTPTDSPERSGFYDYKSEATITPTANEKSVTCTLVGYNVTDRPLDDRSGTFNFAPPTCQITIVPSDNCEAVDLTCDCMDSNPDITIYQFYDGSDQEMDAPQKEDAMKISVIPMEGYYTYGCKGCNGVNFGASSYDNKAVPCVPTTETTTTPDEEPPLPPPPPGLSTLVIIVIICCVLGVCAGGSVVAGLYVKNKEMWCFAISTSKKGGNVEPPVYGKVNKDRKKSDKPGDNGASPGVDPEIPAYGVIDKNRKSKKDGQNEPTPAPRNSTKQPSNSARNDSQVPMQEVQYADLDHGTKKPSNEIIQPKDEPTEYATVQSVIV